MDIAMLGIGATSGPIRTAAQDLDKLTDSSRKTERQTGKTERATRSAATATDRMGREIRETERSARGLNATSAGLTGTMRSFQQQAIAVATSLGLMFTAGSAIADARELDSALGEVSTLLPVVQGEIEAIEDAARSMGVEFATGATPQAEAFYQAISAGAGDAAASTLLLDQANRVAIGGVTDVTTAVDILTTATNAYAAQNLSAADAADILFVGMRAGKTTIGELATTLGRVLPAATAVGVEFEEVVAATAALTTQGQSTEMAVTGIAGALSQILAPSSQAQELANRLGIEFNVAGLRARGFAGFMEHVVEKTGGSEEALAELFGSIEALRAVFSLAGQGGVQFAQIMTQMEDRAGAADQAFERVSDRADFRLSRALAFAGEHANQMGTTLLNVLVPAGEELIKVFTDAEDKSVALDIALKALTVTLGVLFLRSVGTAVAAMIAASWQTGIWGTALQLLTVRGGAAIVMSQALGAAVRFALGPVGLMIAAVGLLTAAWVNHQTPVERVRSQYAALYEQLEMVETIQGEMGAISLQRARDLLVEAEAAETAATAEAELALARQRARVAQLERAAGDPLTSSGERAGANAALIAAREELRILDDEQFERRLALAGATEELRRQVNLLLIEERNRDRERRRARGERGAGLPETTKEYENTVASLERSVATLSVARGIEQQIVQNLLAAGLSPDNRTSDAARRIIELTHAITDLEDQAALDAFNRDMEEQNALLSVGVREREALAAVLGLERKTLDELTPAQRESIRLAVQANQALRDQRDILDRIAEPYERYRATTEALVGLLQQGAISQQQFNFEMQQAESNLLQDHVDSGNATPFEGIIAGLDRVAERGRNVAASLRDSFGNFFNDLSSGIANSIGRAIVFSEDLGDALTNVAANAMASLIAAVIELGIQWLLQATIGKAIGSAMAATSMAQGAAVAAAWAPAAAAVSLATMGANAIPAMGGMASSYALSQALAAMGGAGFMSGGWTGDGPVNQVAGVVHGQEGVLNAPAMRGIGRDNLDYMNRTGRMPPPQSVGGGGDRIAVFDLRNSEIGRDAMEDLRRTVRDLDYKIEESEQALPERVREINISDGERGLS